MLQVLWSTLQNMFKCSAEITCSEALTLLCSAFVNPETEDCYPKFLLKIEYGDRLGSVTGVRHFCVRTHISLQIFERPEI